MKIIGTTSQGGILVEVSVADAQVCRRFVDVLVPVAPAESATTQQPAPASPTHRRKPQVKASSKTAPEQTHGLKPCAVCGKPFKPTTSARTCSEACREQRRSALDKQARLQLIKKLNTGIRDPLAAADEQARRQAADDSER